MDILALASVLVFTFGLVSFGTLSVLWIREFRSGECDVLPIHGVMAIFSTFWFAALLISGALQQLQPEWGSTLPVLTWALAFVWPPLIMQMVFREAGVQTGRAGWRVILAVAWVAGILLSLLPVSYALGLIPGAWLRWAQLGFASMFILTGVFALLLGWSSSRAKESREERSNRIWNALLWGLLIVVMGTLIVGRPGLLQDVFEILGPAFPILFVFVNTYYLERLTFFDVFVKRGSFSLLVLLLLAAFFELSSFVWERPGLEGARVWLSALLFLPLALSLPWVYNQLSNWLDRVWLGRRFQPQEAIKHFLGALQEATTEEKLIEQAEQRLTEIVQAPVRVVQGADSSAAAAESTVDVPVRVEGEVTASLRVGRRFNRMPLFSSDLALLVSLADVFASNLENLRLQRRKRDQEQRAQELMIHASQSELKALRAQINPHFLFNALNAIASLIPREPERAEETVEQLAEVFRYTLRDSDKEWTRLEDEMEFVRAYLEVEKARFGARLRTSLEMEPELASARIPTMIVQTLVENSVKHGIMGIREAGEIRVRAWRQDDSVYIEVADNGPGFGRELREGEIPPSTKGSGFGLRSVQERLRGYFGQRAQLRLGRDAEDRWTQALIVFPVSVVRFRRRTG